MNIVLTSVRAWVTRTSQPEYPSSESSRVKKSLSSARKTPSATNFLLLLIWADILTGTGYTVVDESDGYQPLSGRRTFQKRIQLYSARDVPMADRRIPLRVPISFRTQGIFSTRNVHQVRLFSCDPLGISAMFRYMTSVVIQP